MTKIVAVVAMLLVVLAGAYTGQAATPEAALFYANIKTQDSRFGRVVTVKSVHTRSGKKVGWANTVCLPLGNSSSQCVGTFILPLGKISVAGTRHSPRFFVFAITGGTGYYHGWGGSLVGRTVANGTERLVFQAVRP